MNRDAAYKYDVAFSFLAADLPVAKDLASRLEPGLTTFVYERRKEELLGREGMDAFSEVFRRDARLTVVLYREGWGQTEWTAFEELAIKSRALETRFTSFMVVRLDKAPLPTWIPSHQLYASEDSDTRPEMAAVIRARAKEQGAVVRKLSAAEIALQRARAAEAQAAREARARGASASDEIRAELRTFYAEIARLVSEIQAGGAAIDIRAGSYGDRCVITGGGISTGLVFYATGITLREFVLRVNRWNAPHALPSASDPEPGGMRHAGADHFVPVLSEDDEWVWQSAPELDNGPVIWVRASDDVYRSSELADWVVGRHVERLFERRGR